MGGQVLDLRICTRFSSCLKHLSLQVSITSSWWWLIEVKMDIKQTASRDLWPIWPSHKIISDISTNQEIFIFSYFYCQGFKTESCPSKSFPLLPLPHLARPQVFFKKLSRPQVGVKLQVAKKYENVKGQQIDLPAGYCWPAQKVACLSSQYLHQIWPLLPSRLEIILLEGNLLTQVPVNHNFALWGLHQVYEGSDLFGQDWYIAGSNLEVKAIQI